MAGEWIKVETSLPEKPEVMRIARALDLEHTEVIGKLIRLWIWFDKNSVDGSVDGLVDVDVDDFVIHGGFSRAMRAVGWLADKPGGGGLTLPNFNRHNGESAKKRALKNERQARWRSRSVDVAASTVATTREEKRREEKKTQPAPLPAWIPEDSWHAWLEVRSKKKIPNTPRALSLAVSELTKLRDQGQDPKAVLEAATLKGWRGLFPVSQVAATPRPDL